MRGILSFSLVAVLLLGACSSNSKTAASENAPAATTSTVPAPAGLPAFYAIPGPAPARPGSMIKSEPVTEPKLHGKTYRVMYTSTTVHGAPIAVTGLVIVPSTPAPAGGYPVVSWGHGTTGMADKCAPSLDPASAVPLANSLLDQGWEITATDYQGLGTPGLLPYIAGESAARNAIDIVRAARDMPDAHASDNYVGWGHSEGGQTAMYVLKLGPTYAPELHLKGVVAGATPSQFNLIYSYLKDSPSRFLLLMAAAGLNTAYGDTEAPLDQVLTPQGKALIPQLDTQCNDVTQQKLANLDMKAVSKGDPFTMPAWRKVLEANDPEQFNAAIAVPLLIIHGGNDQLIPPASTQLLAQHLCGLHQDLERWVYPGQDHGGVVTPSMPDMVHWIRDRFANAPNPDPYKPVGVANVDVTVCP